MSSDEEEDYRYAQRVQAGYDEGGYSDEEEERKLTPEERRKMGARQLKIISAVLCLFGGALGGLAYYVTATGFGGGSLTFPVAGLGLLIMLMSCLGCCGAVANSHKLLLLNYSCLLFASMAALVAGGFCFILNQQAVDAVAENWEEVAAIDGLVGGSGDAEEALKLNLYAVGGLCFVIMLLLFCAMGATANIVSRDQAYSLLLQASNMTMLPMGIVMVAAAVFIADTAASADSPSTAFLIFILGALVCGITLLGCVSVAISSRGLIKVFMFIVALLSLVFFAFGVFSFVQAETLKAQITANWSTIRRVLPPTFSGKYDQEQFTRFLEANLNAVGFLTLCVGALLLTQAYAGCKLRDAIKEADADEADDDPWGEGGRDVMSRAFGEKPRDSGACCNLKRCWKRNWTKGSTKSRCWVRCGCLCLCLFLLIIVGICTSALYFSTACNQLAEFSATTKYNPPTGVTALNAMLYNNYTRGLSQVSLDTSTRTVFVEFEKSALSEGFAAKDNPPGLLIGNSLQLTADPKEATQVMGFDVSCQQSTMTAFIPPMQFYPDGDSLAASKDGITITMKSDEFVAAEASLTADAPRFKFVDIETQHGAITLDTVKLGDLGAELQTSSGEIYLTQVNGICNPLYVGDDTTGGVRMTTALGGIRVEDATLTDCEIVAKGDAALISLNKVTSVASRGVGALIKITGEKGLIELKKVAADEYDLKGNIGSVKGEVLTVQDSLKASSVSGNVVLTDVTMALRASLQVETTSGKVIIKLLKFAGFVSLHSSSPITIVQEGTHWSQVQRKTENKMNTLTANVNCASRGNCAYLGELLVISSTGTISVEVDAWDQSS